LKLELDLGQYAGKIWRIGLMGHTCNINNIILFLNALAIILKDLGFNCDNSDAINEVYNYIKGY